MEKDLLNFFAYLNIELKKYQLLSSFRTKGWILNELIYFNKIPKSLQNKNLYIQEIDEKYLDLFEPKINIESDIEQLIFTEIFGEFNATYYNTKFLMMLDFYLENPHYNMIEFMTKIMPAAIKTYEKSYSHIK